MKLSRELISLIAANSNWNETNIQDQLIKNVYPGKNAWMKFLRLFLLSTGVAFAVSGIVFFFAYNWEDLHKFLKLGIIEGLIIGIVLTILLFKMSDLIRNILLSGASVLVGVLFAVFGQIYQTGANAYDFFLGWTIFVFLWTLVSGFPALWLIFLTLVNATVILYSQQVAINWDDFAVLDILYAFNIGVIILSLWLSEIKKIKPVPMWLIRVVAIVSVFYITLILIDWIVTSFEYASLAGLILMIPTYYLGIRFSFRKKDVFFLAITCLSIIIIISFFIIRHLGDGSSFSFFVVTVFLVASISMLIKSILNLIVKWSDKRKESSEIQTSDNSASISDTLEIIRVFQDESPDFQLNEETFNAETKTQKITTSGLTVKILSILGGIMASLSFMAFLAIANIFDSELATLALGVVFIFGATRVEKYSKTILLDTFCISMYLIGYILFGTGLEISKVDTNFFFLFFMLFAFISFFITKNLMLIFIAVLMFMGSSIGLILNNKDLNFMHLYLFVNVILLLIIYLNESKLLTIKRIQQILSSLRIGLVITFIAGVFIFAIRNHLPKMVFDMTWISSIPIIAAAIVVIFYIFRTLNLRDKKTQVQILVYSLLALSSSAISPPIAASLLVIILGFYSNHRTGFALGFISLIYSVSQFYYDLSFTLLVKSGMMSLSGIILLVGFYFMNKKSKGYEEV